MKKLILAVIISVFLVGYAYEEKDAKIIKLEATLKLLKSQSETLEKSLAEKQFNFNSTESELRVFLAKVKMELSEKNKVIEQLKDEKQYRYGKKFADENKLEIRKSIKSEYLTYLVSLFMAMVLFMALSYSLKLKLSGEREQMKKSENKNLALEKEQRDIEHKYKGDFLEKEHEYKNKIKELETKISQGEKNEVLEKVNNMQRMREKRVAQLKLD